MFQSTPGISAGRYLGQDEINASVTGFNPRPAFLPGDTCTHAPVSDPLFGFNPRPAFLPGDTSPLQEQGFSQIQFQSTPGISAGRYRSRRPTVHSILCFNPRPAFLPGDTRHAQARLEGHGSFNPRPAFLPGDTPSRRSLSATRVVSIHARHFCRAIQPRPLDPVGDWVFQSTPGISAGRYSLSPRKPEPSNGFNPRPAFLPGDTRRSPESHP